MVVDGYDPFLLSPSGHLLVYSNADDNLEVYDLEQGEFIQTLYDYYSYKLAFSSDSRMLAGALRDGSIRIWDIESGTIFNGVGGPDTRITDLSFSPDNDYLIAAAGGSAWVWRNWPSVPVEEIRLFEKEYDRNLVLYDDMVTAVDITSDNNIVVIGTSNRKIWVFDRTTREFIYKLEAHTSAIEKLAISPNDSMLISTDVDGTIMLWDLENGLLARTIHKYAGEVKKIQFQSDSSLAAILENSILLVEALTGIELERTGIGYGTFLGVSPDSNQVIVYEPFQTQVWDFDSGDYMTTLEGEAEDIYVEYWAEGSIFRQYNVGDFSEDGKWIVVAGAGGTWIYDSETYEIVHREKIEDYYIVEFELSNDNNWLATCNNYGRGGNITLYDLAFHSKKYDLPINYCALEKMKFDPSEEALYLISNYWNEPVRFYEISLQTKAAERYIEFPDDTELSSLAINPDGTLAAIGTADGRILFVDLVQMEIIHEIEAHLAEVTHLDFSGDGLYLASTGTDSIVRVWGLP